MKNILKLTELSQYKQTLPILYILNDEEKLNKSHVAHRLNVKSSAGVINALETLEKLKLIIIDIEEPNTHWVSLTEKGKQISDLVCEIAKLLD